MSRFFVGPSLSVYQIEEIELIGGDQCSSRLRREQRTSHERSRHNEDNGRFPDYFIHLLLGVELRDAPVGSTIWIQRI